MQKYIKEEKGFTLVELIVVILMIGILTAVAVPNYRRSVYRAEMTEGLTNGKTIYDSVLRYRGVNNESPTSFKELDVGFFGSAATGSTFNDGTFLYDLDSTNQYVEVYNEKAGYKLLFMFPEVTNDGVTMPILCCPTSYAAGTATGQWLCNNVAQPADSVYLNQKGLSESCREIK